MPAARPRSRSAPPTSAGSPLWTSASCPQRPGCSTIIHSRYRDAVPTSDSPLKDETAEQGVTSAGVTHDLEGALADEPPNQDEAGLVVGEAGEIRRCERGAELDPT